MKKILIIFVLILLSVDCFAEPVINSENYIQEFTIYNKDKIIKKVSFDQPMIAEKNYTYSDVLEKFEVKCYETKGCYTIFNEKLSVFQSRNYPEHYRKRVRYPYEVEDFNNPDIKKLIGVWFSIHCSASEYLEDNVDDMPYCSLSDDKYFIDFYFHKPDKKFETILNINDINNEPYDVLHFLESVKIYSEIKYSGVIDSIEIKCLMPNKRQCYRVFNGKVGVLYYGKYTGQKGKYIWPANVGDEKEVIGRKFVLFCKQLDLRTFASDGSFVKCSIPYEKHYVMIQ